MNKNIPDKINMANVYRDGVKLIGVSEEVEIPEFEAVTDGITGFGMLGTIETPAVGHYDSMEMEIPFSNLCEDIFSLADPTEVFNLTLRASLQQMNGTGALEHIGIRVVVRGACKKFTSGKVKQGEKMEASATLELSYIMIEIDGKQKIELDKLNCIFKVNGKDLMQKIRGLA